MGEVKDKFLEFDREMTEVRERLLSIVDRYGIKDPQNKISITFQEPNKEGKPTVWLVFSHDLWEGCF